MELKKVKLKELGEISTGNTPSKKIGDFYNSDDIMFIKPDDLSRDKVVSIKESKEYISKQAKSKARIIPRNSLLVTCIGIIGKIGILEQDIAAFNQQINAIIPNEEVVHNKYLAYLLLYNRKRIESIANAPIVPIINKTQFSEFEVYIDVNREKQQKIAETLDKAWELIEKRKQQIHALDELTQSIFYDMFGDPVLNEKKWSVVELKEIIILANNGLARRGNDLDGNIVLRLVELQDGYINYNAPNKIKLDVKEKRRYLLKNNDFLFARVNGNPDNVGRCASFKDIGEDVYHNDHIIRVRFDETRINNTFASVILNSKYGKLQIKDKLRTSAGQYTINQEGVSKIRVPLPEIRLQNRFAEIVGNIEKQKELFEASLKELEDNFNALMQKAFKGELF